MTGKEEMTLRDKKQNKKTVLFSLLAAVFTLIALSALPVQAADSFFVYTNPQTGYSVYIDDDQDLLTDAQEQALIEQMTVLTEFGNAGFISCENYSTSTASYSAQRYASLFGSDSGAILVIDMGQRMIYIKNNGAVSRVITNAYSNTITDNIYRYASDGDYYGCASACYSQIYTVLQGGKISQPMRYISAALLALVLGFLINYLFLRTVTRPGRASKDEIMDAAKVDFILRNPNAKYDYETKVYDPVSSSGGIGSRGGGGGFSGGGGSGGGHGF
jgi:uncharacterized protein